MATKSDDLRPADGEDALALSSAISRVLSTEGRLRYCLQLFQAAEYHARHPESEVPSSLCVDRAACGLGDVPFDQVVGGSRMSSSSLVIPNAALLHRIVMDAIEELIACLALSSTAASSAPGLHERAQALVAMLPRVDGDHVPPSYVGELTRPRDGHDSVHALVSELQSISAEFQATLARETIDGATAYRIADEDRSLLQAFMRGVARTRHLSFVPSSLATAATRVQGALIVQIDIGRGDGNLLEVRVSGVGCEVTYATPHVRAMRFFQGLLSKFEVAWAESRPNGSRSMADLPPHHRCTGRLAAKDPAELARFLEQLGSRVVFLLDWNRARKRLRNFVDGAGSIEVLRWAADQDVGHRAFLQLGGERLVFEAIESAAPSPLRYGQRLDEMLGRRATIEFLQFMLHVTSVGLQNHRSLRFIHDEIRADLLGRFETLEHGVLAVAAEHSRVVVQLSEAVLEELGSTRERSGDLPRRAGEWELVADQLVNRVRTLARHSPRAQLYARLLGEADDVADDLEEAAFLLSLPPARLDMGAVRAPLLSLAAVLVTGCQHWDKCLEAAARVERGSTREGLQDFLDAVDRVVTLEDEADAVERQVITALFGHGIEYQQLHLLTLVTQSFEHASDTLARCALHLRDHVLGDLAR